ncbi:MAG: hypothetical protein E7591_03040 [Ruminococcaceae bacterium]|nr:hypothetical protein [Oscillospiraceae bacterium]
MISFNSLFNTDPEAEYFPEYDCNGEYKGIKALTYRGADYKGKPTRIFAHIGFPESAEGSVPAVVLIHGGGGHPDDEWIKRWNAEGYAAIAMSTDGYFPARPVNLYEGADVSDMVREFSDPFYKEGHTILPANMHMSDSDITVTDQWIYQAVAAVILAVNLLRADEGVDPCKIGICGISWGAVVASVAVGYDPRFAFAVPIYGSGYLACGLSGLDRIFKAPGVQKWFPERRFHKVKTPVLWLCWNDDCCFSINSNSMSYLDTKDNNINTRLSMLQDMGHSHSCAYTARESYWFANEILSGRTVPEVTAEYIGNTVRYSCGVKPGSVRLFYITEEMSYTRREKYGLHNTFMEQEWQITYLDPEHTRAKLPGNAKGKYIEFTLENGIVLTTPYSEFKG